MLLNTSNQATASNLSYKCFLIPTLEAPGDKSHLFQGFCYHSLLQPQWKWRRLSAQFSSLLPQWAQCWLILVIITMRTTPRLRLRHQDRAGAAPPLTFLLLVLWLVLLWLRSSPTSFSTRFCRRRKKKLKEIRLYICVVLLKFLIWAVFFIRTSLLSHICLWFMWMIILVQHYSIISLVCACKWFLFLFSGTNCARFSFLTCLWSWFVSQVLSPLPLGSNKGWQLWFIIGY